MTLAPAGPREVAAWDGQEDRPPLLDPPPTPPKRRWWQPKTAAHRAYELWQEQQAAVTTIRLQDDPALAAAKSWKEIRRDRRNARDVRAAEAEQERSSALAATQLAARSQAAANELAAIANADKVGAARASAECRRLTEPGARLAGLYRTQRWLSRLMLSLVSGGIGWMAVNVHNAAVDSSTRLVDPMWWLSYLIDPLISVPLVVLLNLRGVAARYGRPFGGPRIFLLEIALLALSAGLNLSGVAGHRLTAGVLMSHVTPPVMVALIVLMYAPVMTYLGGLLAQAYEDAQAATRSAHLTEDEKKEARRVGLALIGIRSGELPLGENGMPSTNQVEKFLRQANGSIAKANAQRVAEQIQTMFGIGLTV